MDTDEFLETMSTCTTNKPHLWVIICPTEQHAIQDCYVVQCCKVYHLKARNEYAKVRSDSLDDEMNAMKPCPRHVELERSSLRSRTHIPILNRCFSSTSVFRACSRFAASTPGRRAGFVPFTATCWLRRTCPFFSLLPCVLWSRLRKAGVTEKFVAFLSPQISS